MSNSIHSSRSASQSSRRSNQSASRSIPPPGPTLTPSHDGTFETCAATASFFLYAQRNVILCLHHDTLAIERRFERHKEDVQLISVDNISDQGSGRLVVSYDASQTTIVWDLFTGQEVARFASYEEIRVAVWMKNTNIAFGNSQGNVILFEPATSEHISARTIFDPITALAPSSDCRTFAIGYMNGSILIANLQPSFTILHTLSTNRPPSPLNKLAWHGSSSKQKSDMLAAQTVDGDLRVWSIPKSGNTEPPSIIRVLSRSENDRISGANWFGWSKMGRIVQYSEGLTFVWDVRTKRVTYESVPTVDGLVGITNYGASATLFTLGRNHTVQQYDLNPTARPMLVQNVQHVPAKLPPTPPITDGELGNSARYATAGGSNTQQPNTNVPFYLEVDSSDGEQKRQLSPLRHGFQSPEHSEEERDMVGPLSPVSSRSSLRSRSSNGGLIQNDSRPSSRNKNATLGNSARVNSPSITSNSTHSGSNATTFSQGSSHKSAFPNRAMRESISTRSLLSSSTTSGTSKRSQPSRLRQEVIRSPQYDDTAVMDLFPFTRARLADIPFQPPQYDATRRTPDDLRVQMLNVVFGWPDDIVLLIRDELSRHPAGSAGGILLSKWLGDLGPDFAASMIGSESMTSSDWMLLALSGMEHDSQKKVGESFVQRLLEKGDIHPAVAILLGLGEYDDAVEIYVSRKFYMEAVLLACLLFPTDWQRQSHLVRKWGEVAVASKQAELAVRCFSCTSVESSEPWFSPRAQDAVYAMQQRIIGPDTPLSMGSPISAGGAAPRLHPSMAGLKLVTNFNNTSDGLRSAADDKTPMVYAAETPIESAITPGGALHRPFFRGDPMSAASARTATPGGYGRRRLPSQQRDGSRNASATPQISHVIREPTTSIKYSSRAPSEATTISSYRNRSASASQAGSSLLSSSTYQPATAVERGRSGLPSPAQGVFARLREEQSHGRNGSRERKPEGLSLHTDDIIIIDESLGSGVTNSEYTHITTGSPSITSAAQQLRRSAHSPPITGNSFASNKIRSINQYINSLEEANQIDKQKRAPSRSSRSGTADQDRRPRSRTAHRAPSEARPSVRYVKPAKRSPSSPVSMSPDDPALQLSNAAFDDERFYTITSPAAESNAASFRRRDRSRSRDARAPSKPRRGESTSKGQRMRSRSRTVASRQNSQEELDTERRGRSRSNVRVENQTNRSPESPTPMSPAGSTMSRSKVGERVRERSMSRRARSPSARRPSPDPSISSRQSARAQMPKLQTNLSDNGVLRTREQAAQELEARRLSLARRPSAPPIVHPDALIPKSAIEPSTDPNDSSFFGIPSELEMIRGHTADPHALRKLASGNNGTSSRSVPIGLPATPRAMRHPKYMGNEAEGDNVPAVPGIPDSFAHFNPERAHQQPLQQDEGLMLLPASTFQPSRSASAPPDKLAVNVSHQRRPSNTKPAHSRQNSSNSVTVVLPSPVAGGPLMSRSIDEALNQEQPQQEEEIIVVEHSPEQQVPSGPVVLPELQHLAGPTPPPPPPPPPVTGGPQHRAKTSIGVINISIQEETGRAATPNLEPLQLPSRGASPEAPSDAAKSHRRGRGSMSEGMGMKTFRTVRDKLRDRSASRNRTMTISPPVPAVPAPYESNPQPVPGRPAQAPQPYESTPQPVGRAAAPYESTPQPHMQRRGSQPTQSRPPAEFVQLEQTLLPSTTYGGYRNPKDIAKQMTQEQMQFGTIGASIHAGTQDVPDRAATQSVPALPMRAPARSNSVYAGYRSRELRANMPPEQLQFGVEPHPDGSGRI